MDNIWNDISCILLTVAVAVFVICMGVCLWYLAMYLKKDIEEWESEKKR